MAKLAFYTLGCRSNQYETDKMKRACSSAGHEIVPFENQADYYIINTCTVTGNADKKSRNAIRSAKKRNANSIVIVTGCYVETKNFSIKEADVILRNKNKFDIVKYIKDKRIGKSNGPLISDLPSPRIRANLMIENGCENFCSYCIVPFVRGKVTSVPQAEVIAEAKELVRDGVKEIVLTGINIGEYGKMTNDQFPMTDKILMTKSRSSLPKLIDALSKINGLLRIRISSIEPQYVDDALIKVVKENPKVCKHFHIPLQSGDDRILKSMQRKYASKDFLAMVKKINGQIKDVAITTDIIVGFPGEDEKAFKNTVKLANKAHFSRIHIFSYSDRPGTAASRMSDKVDPRIIDLRRKALDLFRARQMRVFHRLFTKMPMEVLIEHKDNKNGMYEGLTSNYIRVFLRSPLSEAKPSRRGDDMGDDCLGRLIPAKFREFEGENVIATPILV